MSSIARHRNRIVEQRKFLKWIRNIYCKCKCSRFVCIVGKFCLPQNRLKAVQCIQDVNQPTLSFFLGWILYSFNRYSFSFFTSFLGFVVHSPWKQPWSHRDVEGESSTIMRISHQVQSQDIHSSYNRPLRLFETVTNRAT